MSKDCNKVNDRNVVEVIKAVDSLMLALMQEDELTTLLDRQQGQDNIQPLYSINDLILTLENHDVVRGLIDAIAPLRVIKDCLVTDKHPPCKVSEEFSDLLHNVRFHCQALKVKECPESSVSVLGQSSFFTPKGNSTMISRRASMSASRRSSSIINIGSRDKSIQSSTAELETFCDAVSFFAKNSLNCVSGDCQEDEVFEERRESGIGSANDRRIIDLGVAKSKLLILQKKDPNNLDAILPLTKEIKKLSEEIEKYNLLKSQLSEKTGNEPKAYDNSISELANKEVAMTNLESESRVDDSSGLGMLVSTSCHTRSSISNSDISKRDKIANLSHNSSRTQSSFSSYREVSFYDMCTAVKCGRVTTLQRYVSKGVVINMKDKDGNTLLHVAAKNAPDDMVKYLMKEGLSLESCNKKGDTPLNTAIQNKNVKGALLFIEKDTDNATIEHKNVDGNRPLHLAVKYDLRSVVEKLIKKGADPYAENDKGEKPLDLVKPSSDIKLLFLKYEGSLKKKNVSLRLSCGTPGTTMDSAQVESALSRVGKEL